jgi:hypothetical protein
MLKSLSILGLKDYADALFEALNAVFAEKSNAISDTTMDIGSVPYSCLETFTLGKTSS